MTIENIPDIKPVNEVASLDDYMKKFGPYLGQNLRSRLNPLHTPGVDKPIVVNTMRKPITRQADIITAGIKAWRSGQKSLILNGECGVGKTYVSQSLVHGHANDKPYRALVFCPPHLVVKWGRELRMTIPGCTVHLVEKWSDLTALRDRPDPVGPEWWVMSNNTAKLGPSWKPAYKQRLTKEGKRNQGYIFCPSCERPLMKEKGDSGIVEAMHVKDLEKARHSCEMCNEPLWQWHDKPRRWPGASYISRQLRGMFDYLIIDEAHEEKGEDTAQGNAAGTLISACRHVLAMTGTLIGGQADHLRTLMYRLNPTTLQSHGYGWDDYMPFNEKYGRIERRVSSKSNSMTIQNRQSRGSSGKVTKIVRPGVMPSLFGDHLIGNTLFLSLSDISEQLPPLVERAIPVDMPVEMADHYRDMESVLTEAIKQMAARGDRRMLGAMLQALLCYPDKPYEWGAIGYEDTDKESGQKSWVHVYQPHNLYPGLSLPKEEQLIADCLAEKREGRQVWVFTTMTDKRDVLTRLQAKMLAAGLRADVLRAEVPPKKREEWIYAHGKGADVILSHPKLVETGLDLFDKGGNHNFATLAFFMTGYNLFTMRQASRRAFRIGQQHECRVLYYYYSGTMQERALTLMGKKLAAAQAIEGKFSSDGLVAMAGEEGSMEMALAQSLVNQLQGDIDAAKVWSEICGTPVLGSDAPLPKIEVVPQSTIDEMCRMVRERKPAQRAKVFVAEKRGQYLMDFREEKQLALFG